MHIIVVLALIVYLLPERMERNSQSDPWVMLWRASCWIRLCKCWFLVMRLLSFGLRGHPLLSSVSDCDVCDHRKPLSLIGVSKCARFSETSFHSVLGRPFRDVHHQEAVRYNKLGNVRRSRASRTNVILINPGIAFSPCFVPWLNSVLGTWGWQLHGPYQSELTYFITGVEMNFLLSILVFIFLCNRKNLEFWQSPHFVLLQSRV